MPKATPEEPRVVVRVEPSLKQQAERIAARRDETLSQVLRRALREYVREHAQLELPKAGRRSA
jgi:predicted transcriptional regulator